MTHAPSPYPHGVDSRPPHTPDDIERDTRKTPGTIFYLRRHEGRCCVIAIETRPFTIVGYASNRQRGWSCTRDCFARLRRAAIARDGLIEEEEHAGH
jgi:hypothetical protein